MGIRFGEIDANQILENEFRIGVLESLVESLLNSNPTLVKPSQAQIGQIKSDVAERLKKKYPNSGIEFRKG